MKYYSLDRILKEDATYNMIIGERSNGKTYSVLEYGIKKYFEDGSEMGIIRRMQDDLKGKRGAAVFSSIINNGLVKKYSKGKYNWITYYANRWYFANLTDDHEIKRDEKPFAYGFAISSMEHDKSTSYPEIRTILFDEFITRNYYLPDEFVHYMNVLSTIIRERDDVKIFMLGNTVNKYCPYFDEMGLRHVSTMKSGTIDVYNYGDTNLKVAVEYTAPTTGGKKSDKYFAFDNPKLQMITGGDWEIDIYPHLPIKYVPKQKLFEYFIEFDKETLHCEIIDTDHGTFTYIHKKTTEIKDEEKDLIFSSRRHTYQNNIRRKITKVYDRIGEKIYEFYKKDKVFYQNNEIGELIRNYLIWCVKESNI